MNRPSKSYTPKYLNPSAGYWVRVLCVSGLINVLEIETETDEDREVGKREREYS